MLVNAIILILLSSVLSATFNIQDVVVDKGLQIACHDAPLGVVVDNPFFDEEGQVLVPVVFWVGLNNPSGSFSSCENIKPENLRKLRLSENASDDQDLDLSNLRHKAMIEAFERCLIALNIEAANSSQDCKHVENFIVLVIAVLYNQFGQQGVDMVIESIPPVYPTMPKESQTS